MAEEKFLTRREFITAVAAVGGSIAAAVALSDFEMLKKLIDDELAIELPKIEREGAAHIGDSRFKWGMLIDLKKCIGCQYCVHACQAVNDVSDDMRWNVYFPEITAETNVPFHMTRPCLHCNDAPCTAVCPTKATFRRNDGLIVMDYELCIGCRYCQVACPYDARRFNWEERTEPSGYQAEWGQAEVPRRPRGVAEKCTFCIHRIDRGMAQGLMPGIDRAATPACVNICPVEARVFGNLNDPESPVSKAIRERPTFRLREDLGTEPNVYYVPPEGMSL